MSLMNINSEVIAPNKVRETNKSGIRILHEFDINMLRKEDVVSSEASVVKSEEGFDTKCYEVDGFNKYMKLAAASKYCDNHIQSRRRPKKSATIVKDNEEWYLVQDENNPSDKSKERLKKSKSISSCKQLERMYENNRVSYNILSEDSSNHHFLNNKYSETSLTGRSMVNDEYAGDVSIECENIVNSYTPQGSSLQPCKKQKIVRSVDNCGSMSFKSFAEQYSIYAASVAGKEDLENLRNLVGSETLDNKNDEEKISLNSCFKILSKHKSIGFIQQQKEIKKHEQPLCKKFTQTGNNVMRTPGSPVAVRRVSVPLSGIKKLVSTPEFLVKSEAETTTMLRNCGDIWNNYEFNESSPVFGGVVAFVDVRSELFDHSQGIKEMLLSLGAKVEKTFSRQVSHVIFKDGTLKTYSKAKKFNIPLISVLWVEACRREQTLFPFETFVPFGLEKYDSHIITHTGKDSDIMICHAFEVNQYPTENARKCYTCVEKQSVRKCDDTLKKHQKLRSTFRSAHKTIVHVGLSNKEDAKMEDDVHLSKSSDESTFNEVGDDNSYIEESKTVSKIERKSAPSRLMTIRKLKHKNGRSKKNNKNCRQKPETHTTQGGMSKSPWINVCKTHRCICQISENGKNESEECYSDNCRSVYKNDVIENTNFLLECDRNINMCNRVDEAHSDGNSGEDCVNSEIIVGSLKPVTVKKQKRKLLPLESSICISSPLDSTTDSLCSPYYEVTSCQDTSGMDKGLRGIISENIALTDKETLEVQSFLRKESCALFIENKSKKHDFCQRLMATIVCTSMSHKDVEEVESVVYKLGRFRVENKVSYRTTHIVTCKPRRTMNLLKGIARGCWILSQDWVIKSGIAEKWLNEERFELTAFSPAVRQCRLERQAFGPVFSLELFVHVGMIYVCHGTSPSMSDLIELLQLCGGNIVNSIHAADIVIGKDSWQLESGPLFVSEKWILDSVTRNTQLDPHRYKIVTQD